MSGGAGFAAAASVILVATVACRPASGTTSPDPKANAEPAPAMTNREPGEVQVVRAERGLKRHDTLDGRPEFTRR